MPLLPNPVSTPSIKQLYLPEPDRDETGQPLAQEKKAWVKMDVQPINGADVTRGFSNTHDPFGGWLTNRIVEWNFTDEQDMAVPINYENVLRLGATNLGFLSRQPIEQVKQMTDEQKKTSIST